MTDNLLQQAVAAIKSGDRARGKQLLIRILEQDSKNEMAWLWMSKCVDEQAQKLDCIKHVLAINPNNETAQREHARLLTLANIVAPPSRAPQPPANPPKRKSSIPVLLGLILLAACGCILMTMLLPSTGSGGSNQAGGASSPAAPAVRRIAGNNWFGCTDRDYFEKLISYAVDKDNQAFQQGLSDGLYSGVCTTFVSGETVHITDTAILSGMIKVRRQGDTIEYWTNIEAVTQ